MGKKRMMLVRIEENRRIDAKADEAFFLLLLRGLLLSLRESGILTERQLWAAEDALGKQVRDDWKGGNGTSE